MRICTSIGANFASKNSIFISYHLFFKIEYYKEYREYRVQYTSKCLGLYIELNCIYFIRIYCFRIHTTVAGTFVHRLLSWKITKNLQTATNVGRCSATKRYANNTSQECMEINATTSVKSVKENSSLLLI